MSQPVSRTAVRTLLVVVCLLTASGCSMLHLKPSPTSTDASVHAAKGIRVASANLVTKPGSTEPKVVLSLYEDFLCPVCARFEQQFGPTVNQLIDGGELAADYYMVAILDSSRSQNYSSRAGGAAYCVADADTAPDMPTFRRFHAVLYTQQPSETGSTFPTNAQLAETARQAGASGDASQCIEKGQYASMSAGAAEATNVTATPTVRLNGEDYEFSTPDALAAKVKELIG
jgi:protein-disulfide isomerase